MSDTTDYLADPNGFLAANLVSFTGAHYASVPGKNETEVFVARPHRVDPDHPDRDDLIQYAKDRGYSFDIAIDPTGQYPGTKRLALRLREGDSGVRYLPWRENKLTWLVLDPAAGWAFTGPLQGCNVYVAAVAGGATALLHANANEEPTEAANNAAKDAKAREVLRLLPGGSALTNRLARTDYATADRLYNGFVFGRRQPDGSWRFFLHCVRLGTGGAQARHGALPLPAFGG